MLQIGTLSRLDLGIKDENHARDLYIDMNVWYTEYPNATFSVWHKRNGDQTKYAASGVTFDRETGILKWTPDAYDTFYVGKGLAEIRCVENDVIKKTKDIITEVARSLVLGSGETLAAGWQNFLNAVSEQANDAGRAKEAAEGAKEAAETAQEKAEEAQEAAEEAAEQAVTAATHGPYINATSKTWMVWDAEDEEYKDTGIVAEGLDGEDGYSPSASVTKSGSVTTITITDKNGTTSETVSDGEDGYTPVKGTDYWTAEDIAEMTEETAELLIDDTAGSGDEDVTWSADKITDELGGKVDKVQGKGLSENDFTDEEKEKLDGMIDDAAGDGDTDVTWSADKLVEELDKKLNATEKGAAGGLAELDSAGKVPSAQLPSYVDDVQEYEDTAHFPLTGESGIIYIALDTNKTYRWSGSGYVEISESLALGETSSTAYRGDRGKAAYDHASAKGSAFVSGLYKVTTNAEGHVTAAVPVTKEDITELGIPGSQPDISGKADKDTDAAQGNFAAFDASGNPVDSGHKHSDYLTEHQDISGKVDKVDGYGLSKNDFSDAEKQKLDNMIDDTAGEGDTDKTWSADKLVEEFDDAEEAGKLYKDLTTAAPIQSFTDGAPYPIGLQFAIEPVQAGSGDPSPSNVRPISGFTGANVTVTGFNVWDEETELGIYDTTTGQALPSDNNLRSKHYFAVIPSTTYYVKISTSTTASVRLFWYDKNKNYISSEAKRNNTIVSPANAYYARIHIGNAYGTTYSNDVCINVSDANKDEQYESYKGATYPITFPTSAGTVYGGTVTVTPDGTGELVVDRALATVYSFSGSTGEVDGFRTDTYLTNYNGQAYGNIRCNMFRRAENYNQAVGELKNSIGANSQGRILLNAYINDAYITTFEALNSLIPSGGCQIEYGINPVTYSLTPGQVLALLGQNNVWADTGDIQSLSYVRNTVPEMIRQDTAGQIASALDPVEFSLAIVIDGDIAPTGGLASGKYVFLRSHSTLARGTYRTTATIADGASVTENNVQRENVIFNNDSVQGDFGSLETVLSSRLTITEQSFAKAGNIVTYSARFTTGSSEIPATTDLINGFKFPFSGITGAATCVLYDHTASPKEAHFGIITTNQRLQCIDALPANHSIRFSVTYYTEF